MSKEAATIKDDLSETEKSIKEDYITPPDGGRGWFVVSASFMVRQKKNKQRGIV